ncbi:hypothetical protein DXG01_011043, partial [Tephrocybe rancida]
MDPPETDDTDLCDKLMPLYDVDGGVDLAYLPYVITIIRNVLIRSYKALEQTKLTRPQLEESDTQPYFWPEKSFNDGLYKDIQACFQEAMATLKGNTVPVVFLAGQKRNLSDGEERDSSQNKRRA